MDDQQIAVGDRVYVEGKCAGFVRYIGFTNFGVRGECWYGVQLDNMIGSNNGSYWGKEYFRCRQRYGIFAKRNKIKLFTVDAESKWENSKEDSISDISLESIGIGGRFSEYRSTNGQEKPENLISTNDKRVLSLQQEIKCTVDNENIRGYSNEASAGDISSGSVNVGPRWAKYMSIDDQQGYPENLNSTNNKMAMKQQEIKSTVDDENKREYSNEAFVGDISSSSVDIGVRWSVYKPVDDQQGYPENLNSASNKMAMKQQEIKSTISDENKREYSNEASIGDILSGSVDIGARWSVYKPVDDQQGYPENFNSTNSNIVMNLEQEIKCAVDTENKREFSNEASVGVISSGSVDIGAQCSAYKSVDDQQGKPENFNSPNNKPANSMQLVIVQKLEEMQHEIYRLNHQMEILLKFVKTNL